MAQTATVVGHVTVSSGAAVAGAKVTATNTAIFVTANTVSTTSGTVTLPFLQRGTYSVTFEAPGFASDIRRDIPLDVDQTVNVDFVLQLSSIRQTIEVTGAAPLLQMETAKVGQELTSKTIVTLPLNGRDYTQLVTLSAGASPNPTAHEVNCLGTFSGPVLMEYNYQGRTLPHVPVCLDFHNGKLYPNERPGLGVELDMKYLKLITEITQPVTNRAQTYFRPDGSITNW